MRLFPRSAPCSLAVALTLFAGRVAANPALTPAPAVDAGELTKVAGGLLLVLAVIAGLGWAAQRLRQVRGGGGRHLRILDALPLGTRERLVLVEVDGERVLIGIAGGRIERLHALRGSGGFSQALASVTATSGTPADVGTSAP